MNTALGIIVFFGTPTALYYAGKLATDYAWKKMIQTVFIISETTDDAIEILNSFNHIKG